MQPAVLPHTVVLPSGERVPALGQGTWNMGERAETRAEEIAALQMGIDHGLSLIDTAEMYGNGRSEGLVAQALFGRRDKAFLVSKVLPENATRRGTPAACERSLKRLATDRIDLYLLHWRGSVPLAESLEALVRLKDDGKIRHYGVSNLDLTDMQECERLKSGACLTTNQLLYNLSRRGIEWDLLPWLRARHVPVMAYSPLEQARLLRHKGLAAFATKTRMTPAQVAIAWLLSNKDVIAIPKSGNRIRLKENLGALDQPLTAHQLRELDTFFPPPKGPRPLEML